MRTIITILFSFLLCNNILCQEVKDNFLGCHFNMKKADVLKVLDSQNHQFVVHDNMIDIKGISLNGYEFSFLRFYFNSIGLYRATYIYEVTDPKKDNKTFTEIKILLENKYYKADINEDYFHYFDGIRTITWVNMDKQYWLMYCDLEGEELYEDENNF